MKMQRYSRREFMKTSAGAVGAAHLLAAGAMAEVAQEAKQPAQTVLPRWRGFNLTYFFTRRDDARPAEDDFRWLQDWGFNFIRLPMSYELWVERDDWYKVKEEMLARIDQVVDLGRKYGLHVSLNFHRGPGYCVNPPEEKLSLWKDEAGGAGVLLALEPVRQTVPRHRLQATQLRSDQRTGRVRTGA